HPVALGEEAVPAQVHAIALVVDRARNTAHVRAAFQHDGLNLRTGGEFEGCRQSGRSGADDDGGLFSGQSRLPQPLSLTPRTRGRNSLLKAHLSTMGGQCDGNAKCRFRSTAPPRRPVPSRGRDISIHLLRGKLRWAGKLETAFSKS